MSAKISQGCVKVSLATDTSFHWNIRDWGTYLTAQCLRQLRKLL